VAASRGLLEAGEDQVRISRRWWSTQRPTSYVICPAVAGATLAQARGDYATMLAAFEPLSGRQDYNRSGWWWLRVEALIGTGRVDEAAEELFALTAEDVPPCVGPGRAWLVGWLAHRQGDMDAAQTIYADALGAETPPDDIPFLRARLEHGYGQLLLARRHRREAVGWLRAARERYRTLGAAPFLARCDADLAACGLRAIAAGSPDLRTVLSTQEDRVARLVAQGMTNQEVARELYVSAKTVEGYRPGTPVRQAGEARHHHRVPSRDMRRVRARHPAGRQDQLRRGWPLRPLRLPGRGQPRRAPAGGNDYSDPAGPLCGLRTGHHPR